MEAFLFYPQDPPIDPLINHAPVFNYDIDDRFIEAGKDFYMTFSDYFTDEDQDDDFYYSFIVNDVFLDWTMGWLRAGGIGNLKGVLASTPPDDFIDSTAFVVIRCVDEFGLSAVSNVFSITVIDEVIL